MKLSNLKFLNDISKLKFFKNVTIDELQELNNLGAFSEKFFPKGNIIFHTGDVVSRMGIIVKGQVFIESNDLWGNRSILSVVEKGQAFAESYGYTKSPMLVDAVAAENSTVVFFNLNVLLEEIYQSYSWQFKIQKNLLLIATNKNIILSNRSFCTAPKTIRERLSIYFSQQVMINKSNEFSIPFNRQQLADFLNLDRSALSKELCKMRDEGMIEFHKNQFKLKE